MPGNILNFNVGDNVDLLVPRVRPCLSQQRCAVVLPPHLQAGACDGQLCLQLGSERLPPLRLPCLPSAVCCRRICCVLRCTLPPSDSPACCCLLLPTHQQNFWSRLAGRFGTKFYWQDKGQDVSIVNAVAGAQAKACDWAGSHARPSLAERLFRVSKCSRLVDALSRSLHPTPGPYAS